MKNSEILKKLKGLRQNLDDLQDYFENTKTDEKLELALSALKLVRDFDEEQEDAYGDPGAKYMESMQEINELLKEIDSEKETEEKIKNLFI